MPTLWKHPESKYWFAKITLPDGRRTSRSTKQTDRRSATLVAFALEKTANLARRSELTTSVVVKLARELCEATGAAPVETITIAQQFANYTAGRVAIGCAPSTLARYKPVIDGFLKFIGTARAKASLASLSAGEVEGFRNAEITSGKGRTTADFAVKIIQSVLSDAVRKGLILQNPAQAVVMTGAVAQERQPFTAAELTALLQAANGSDWEGMILLGAHCGIRLSDAAHLTWKAINLADRTLEFIPAKTKKKEQRVLLALHPEIVQWLERQPLGIGNAPLFPSLFTHASGNTAGLSRLFSELMAKAKIAVPLGEQRTGLGRTFRAKGFHGLRHTMVSRMANADTPQAVRQAIAGHASEAAHRRYVHLNVETQRRAVEKMPNLGR